MSYNCHLCNRSYAWLDSLKRHTKHKHDSRQQQQHQQQQQQQQLLQQQQLQQQQQQQLQQQQQQNHRNDFDYISSVLVLGIKEMW